MIECLLFIGAGAGAGKKTDRLRNTGWIKGNTLFPRISYKCCRKRVRNAWTILIFWGMLNCILRILPIHFKLGTLNWKIEQERGDFFFKGTMAGEKYANFKHMMCLQYQQDRELFIFLFFLSIYWRLLDVKPVNYKKILLRYGYQWVSDHER